MKNFSTGDSLAEATKKGRGGEAPKKMRLLSLPTTTPFQC